MSEGKNFINGFREVPKTGVIYVMSEAKKVGYEPNSEKWTNFGQGSPEVKVLPEAPERLKNIACLEEDLEYSPVDGILELKEAIAELYNTRYRKGKKSQYTAENIAICSGGRLALTRFISTLGKIHIGHFLPDYTAYEELLDNYGNFIPIPLQLAVSENYSLSVDSLKEKILGLGLSAIVLSNPRNPTGTLIEGDLLQSWVDLARTLKTTLIFDEFYSHYILDDDRKSVSCAEYVKDVDKDPIVIIDGLTKNWRYPGMRISWTLAPSEIINKIASAGSFIDGGAAKPIQKAILPLLKSDFADLEARAIKIAFRKKRNYLVQALQNLGIEIEVIPNSSFYCWGNLSKLPEKINTGYKIFQEGLKEGLITVPGPFFDINPGRRHAARPSRFLHYSRFSFGPPMEEIKRGVKKLQKLIEKN